jgi:hypothetical protein
MDGIEALVAIVFAMVPVAMRFIARYYRLREKQLQLRAEEPRLLAELIDEKRALEQRVENLESIICAVDFEIDRRLHRLPPLPSAAVATRAAD